MKVARRITLKPHIKRVPYVNISWPFVAYVWGAYPSRLSHRLAAKAVHLEHLAQAKIFARRT